MEMGIGEEKHDVLGNLTAMLCVFKRIWVLYAKQIEICVISC
jgi:hypothetical protein